MKVRQAAQTDADAWIGMRVALWPDASRAELESEVAQYFAAETPSFVAFVCEDADGHPIGMLEISLRSVAEGCASSPIPYIEAWYTMPKSRRRGVGRALMHAAQEWARERGYGEVASDTQLWNDEGARAHLGVGFEEVERAIHFRRALE